jgi:hypothetical protein
MKKLYILLFISLPVFACLFVYFGAWSVEAKIGKKVDNCQPEIECIFKISEITDFQWDKMFVFDYAVPDDEIAKHLGTEYGGGEQFKRQLVFLKDGKIIHQENLLTHVSDSVDDAVQFDGLTYNNPLSFTPDTAVFKAQKYAVGYGDINYYLKQID